MFRDGCVDTLALCVTDDVSGEERNLVGGRVEDRKKQGVLGVLCLFLGRSRQTWAGVVF